MANEPNKLDQQNVVEASGTFVSFVSSTTGDAALIAPANSRRASIIVQVTNATDIVIGGSASSLALTISGSASSVFPNFMELKTKAEIYARVPDYATSPAALSITELSDDGIV